MKVLLLLLFSAMLISCNRPLIPQQSNTIFEGFVESNMTYENMDTALVAIFEKTTGSKMIAYIKDGFTKRIYYDKNHVIISSDIYIRDSMKIYSYSGDSDTIEYTNLTRTDLMQMTSFKGLSSKKILNHYCKGVAVSSNTRLEKYDTTLSKESEYYFDTLNRLSPDMFKGCKYGSYDELYRQYPYINLQVRDLYLPEHFVFNQTATRVVKTKLKKSVFILPEHKVIVESN